jgi:hypothetical protein
MKDDIIQKISRFYYRTTAEWNVLIFFFLLQFLCYIKIKTLLLPSIIAKLKIQNDGLIQDGDENFFYFSHNKPPFSFLSLATMFIYLNSFRTALYQKMRTFHSAVVLK